MKRYYRTIPTLLVIVAIGAGCTSAPRYTTKPRAGKTSTTANQKAETLTGRRVVKSAEVFLGTPYRYGGTAASGMDCSGLVFNVFKQFGIALPRTSLAQSSFGDQVNRQGLEPGDLVFFKTGKGSKVSHVGIYSGRGEFIHASTRSKRVKYDRLDNKYFKRRFVTARRVL